MFVGFEGSVKKLYLTADANIGIFGERLLCQLFCLVVRHGMQRQGKKKEDKCA